MREAAAESFLGVLKRERVNRQHYPEPKRERISSAISNAVLPMFLCPSRSWSVFLLERIFIGHLNLFSITMKRCAEVVCPRSGQMKVTGLSKLKCGAYITGY